LWNDPLLTFSHINDNVKNNQSKVRSVQTNKSQAPKYCCGKQEIIAAYLFGSFATDKATPFSDVDIALFTPSAENRMEYSIPD